MRPRKKKGSSTGWTLVEIIVASAVFAILLVGFAKAYHHLRQVMALGDAVEQMKLRSDGIDEVFQAVAPSSIRLFSQDPGSFPFFSRLSAPPPLTGWQAPNVDGSSSGNVFLVLARWKALDVVVGTETVRIDLVRFHYIFPSYGEGIMLGTNTFRELHYWESKPYANLNNINVILSPALKSSVVSYLYSTRGIFYAMDIGAINPNEAFFSLSAGGAVASDPAHTIPQDRLVNLTRGGGVERGSYRIGLAPNILFSAGLLHTVPRYNAASGDFPSGFEVVFRRTNTQRRDVVVRCVLLAKGAFPKPRTYELASQFAVRDVW
ncbi:MAG: hypothetical protein IPP68_06455 [Elusimicrobia bacterium]|nr:hypothetical protein [Elusimicrobiota bacterium]